MFYRKQLVPPSVVLRREQKWLRMLSNWEYFMTKNYKKVSRTFLLCCDFMPDTSYYSCKKTVIFIPDLATTFQTLWYLGTYSALFKIMAYLCLFAIETWIYSSCIFLHRFGSVVGKASLHQCVLVHGYIYVVGNYSWSREERYIHA